MGGFGGFLLDLVFSENKMRQTDCRQRREKKKNKIKNGQATRGKITNNKPFGGKKGTKKNTNF